VQTIGGKLILILEMQTGIDIGNWELQSRKEKGGIGEGKRE